MLRFHDVLLQLLALGGVREVGSQGARSRGGRWGAPDGGARRARLVPSIACSDAARAERRRGAGSSDGKRPPPCQALVCQPEPAPPAPPPGANLAPGPCWERSPSRPPPPPAGQGPSTPSAVLADLGWAWDRRRRSPGSAVGQRGPFHSHFPRLPGLGAPRTVQACGALGGGLVPRPLRSTFSEWISLLPVGRGRGACSPAALTALGLAPRRPLWEADLLGQGQGCPWAQTEPRG